MTSVAPRTDPEATVVHFSASNQVLKWRARKRPDRQQASISFFVACFNSSRCFRTVIGVSSSTVQNRRRVAVARLGAWENRTKRAEKAVPSTPIYRITFGSTR